MVSDRRPIMMDSGATDFMAERDDESEESDEFTNFDYLAQQLLSKPEQDSSDEFAAESVHTGSRSHAMVVDDFDVVPSPDQVNEDIEERKGAIVGISNKGLNIASDKNHFDMAR